MAYLPDYRYDIFLSYASSNDTPVARGTYRKRNNWQWVQLFRAVLGDKLRSNLGRPVAIFFDQDEEDGVRAGDGLHPKIGTALDQSFLFLPLYSNAYRNSVKWCPLEAAHFVAGIGDPPAEKRRVYITHLEKRIESEWQGAAGAGPAAEGSLFFPDVCVFSMYREEPANSKIRRWGENDIEEVGFLEAITDLARTLADRLDEEFKRAAAAAAGAAAGIAVQAAAGAGAAAVAPAAPAPAPAAPPVPPPAAAAGEGKGAILLAAVPGELENLRRSVAEALRVDEWDIRPCRLQNLRHYDPAQCRAETEADLQGALAYVQILGAGSWPHDYDKIQWNAAVSFDPGAAGAGAAVRPAVICWAPPVADLSALADPVRKEWLERIPLWREEPPEFERNLLAELNRLKAAAGNAWRAGQAAPGPGVVVGVSTMPEDQFGLGCDLVAELGLRQVQAEALGPEDLINEIARDGLLIGYGSRDKDKECKRIIEVVREWRKRLAGPAALNALPPAGLYLAHPPAGKRAPCFYSWLQVIAHGDDAAMDAFIQTVRNFAA